MGASAIRSSARRAAAAAALTLGATLSCGPASGPVTREIVRERTWQPEGGARVRGLTSAERFGAVAPPSSAAADDERPRLRWTAPPSWRRAGDRPTRVVTFRLGADEAAECYVAVLPGFVGGSRANVDRWRGQMGQRPLSPVELAALLRIPMLGSEAVVVEIDGTWRGMDGERVEDASLLGAVCELPAHGVFVKLVGPAAAVDEARGAFLAFCESLALEESP